MTPARKALLRQRLLQLLALSFSLAATASVFQPDEVAALMGLFLNGVNGYSQFFAMFVGGWFATAYLALMAARRGDLPILGDVIAIFVLAQAAGRVTAATTTTLPQGLILAMCCAELLSGLCLLALRPAPK